jgi:uncharacterized protein YcfJ
MRAMAGIPSVPKERAMVETLVAPDRETEMLERHPLAEPSLVMGRPVEDRGFEVVQAGVGACAGLAIGTAVAGPIGTVVGGVVGAAAGLLAGERIERAAGHAAETMDAVDE